MAGQRKPVIGILGGSGVYELEGLSNARWERVESPFGAPSDELLFGDLHGVSMVFLPRHGRGHRIPPSEVNYRANVDALKRAGVTDVLSLSACGSLREGLAPGTFVLVDQFIDRTTAREAHLLRRAGCVGHVSMADPICTAAARRAGSEAAGEAGVAGWSAAAPTWPWRGPSSRACAESELYRGLGLRRDRHDQHARGQARPRSGAVLRERRHGDRLRLLAPPRRTTWQVADIVAGAEAATPTGVGRWLRRRSAATWQDRPDALSRRAATRALDARAHHTRPTRAIPRCCATSMPLARARAREFLTAAHSEETSSMPIKDAHPHHSPTTPSRASSFATSPRCCKDPVGLRLTIDKPGRANTKACTSTRWWAIEARGFIRGRRPGAWRYGVGFVPGAQAGQAALDETIGQDYELEYGSGPRRDAHRRDCRRVRSVLLVDDLIATGGTALKPPST